MDTWRNKYENWVMEKVDCRKLIDANEQERYDQVVSAYKTWHEEAKMPAQMMQFAFIKKNFLSISLILDLKKSVQTKLLTARKENGKWLFKMTNKGTKFVESLPQELGRKNKIRECNCGVCRRWGSVLKGVK